MIGIAFKSISYRNFLSVGEVPVELNLEDPGSFLFVGKNGAGKSTMVDALTYALFGKPYRKINKPKLVNSINKRNMLVELEFDIGSNKYKIRRGMKPNIFEVFCNGKILNQDAESLEYQAKLEKHILKLNYAAARQIVLLSKTSYKPFMQLDTKERRPFVEDILNIDIYSIMATLLSKRVSDAKKRLVDLQKDIQHTTEKVEIIRNNIARFLQNTKEAADAKKLRIEEARQQLEEAQARLVVLEPQLKELEEDLEQRKGRRRTLEEAIRSVRVKASSRKSTMQKELSFFEHTAECPTCAQEIDEEYRRQAISERQAVIVDMDTALTEADRRAEKTKILSEQIKDLETRADSINNQLIEFRSNIRHSESLIKSLEKEIEDLHNQKDEYADDYSKIDELQLKRKELSDEKKELLHQSELYKVAAFLLKDGGIKAQIIKQYIPIINKYINKYLAAMDFFIEFQLDENFDEVITSHHRQEFSYYSFSEGEKFRIDLALMLTWRSVARIRNNCNSSILFMDEIFDSSLDDDGIEDLFKIVDTLVSEGTGVYVISHKGDQIKDKFENILRFEKVRNFTQYVEE